jgi:uncharacterized protein YndB with AHSA1/START domain
VTSNSGTGPRVLGSLAVADGTGVVRMEDRVEAEIGEVWSALTDPARLARWYGEVTGDLRLGGEYRARLHASGWEGTGRITACEPPRRLQVSAAEPGEPEHVAEVTLVASGDQTQLVWEERGLRADLLFAFGAGIQVHVEDLVAHLDGRERCDAGARWAELEPAYTALAAQLA